jgi:DNA primase catalytic core
MRFSPQFLDELRARLPVSEVVGRRVRLRKAGREWKGLSPFNKEKTPSFFVNDHKAMWFDFSSGKNGNIFDFVMLTEGVSFTEAVERLAGEAGIAVPVLTREAQAQEERRKTLHDIVELAAKFFETTLAARAGARGRGYLADRGIHPSTQIKFRLGYAPAEQYALKEHLGVATDHDAEIVWEETHNTMGAELPAEQFREIFESRRQDMIAAKQWAPDKPLPDPEQFLVRALLDPTLKEMAYVPTKLDAPMR